jgi:uncharacterized protein
MDGKKLLKYFVDLGLDGVDFLLPDQNHLYGSEHYPKPQSVPTYGRVLADAYLAWRELDDPSFYVRKFAVIIAALFGQTPSLDSLGVGPIKVFTIETSGEVEPVDTLKVCGHGYTKSGVNIGQVKAREINEVDLIKLGLHKIDTLPEKCQTCSFKTLCGGGYLPHRFSSQGFALETVYCADMVHLCETIFADVASVIKRSRDRDC